MGSLKKTDMPKILIVDDDKGIRMLLENYLDNNGFEVFAKESAKLALNWMQAGNLPDLIVADVIMPEVDGFEFIEIVRGSGFFKNIPLIMLSGIEGSSDRIKCLKLGADDFVIKPFNPEELIIRIENLLSRVKDYSENA